MDQGMYMSRTEVDSTTFGDLLSRYLEEITPTKKGAAPETSRIRALLRHPLAKRMVGSIRSLDIARYRNERLQEVAPPTAKRDLVIISHVFEIAIREWSLPLLNPVRQIRLPAHGKPRNRRLEQGAVADENEESRLLRACRQARNPFLLPIVKLAIETAMRQSELVGLRWNHIDLKRRVAYLADTKNGESREVPLSSAAVKILDALPRSVNGAVFPGLTAEAVKRSYARAVRRAKIDNLHFHDLRHEATTRFFERGLNIMEVASITGHKDLRMLRRYTHLRAEDLARLLG